jgi:hypothetical protein
MPTELSRLSVSMFVWSKMPFALVIESRKWQIFRTVPPYGHVRVPILSACMLISPLISPSLCVCRAITRLCMCLSIQLLPVCVCLTNYLRLVYMWLYIYSSLSLSLSVSPCPVTHFLNISFCPATRHSVSSCPVTHFLNMSFCPATRPSVCVILSNYSIPEYVFLSSYSSLCVCHPVQLLISWICLSVQLLNSWICLPVQLLVALCVCVILSSYSFPEYVFLSSYSSLCVCHLVQLLSSWICLPVQLLVPLCVSSCQVTHFLNMCPYPAARPYVCVFHPVQLLNSWVSVCPTPRPFLCCLPVFFPPLCPPVYCTITTLQFTRNPIQCPLHTQRRDFLKDFVFPTMKDPIVRKLQLFHYGGPSSPAI